MRLSPSEREAAVQLLGGRWPRAAAGQAPERFWEWVAFLRLDGVAIAAARVKDNGAATESIPPDARDRALRMGLSTTLHVEVAAQVIEVLERHGVPAVMFKGTSLVASGVYRDPAERPMDDADVLVHPAAARDALEALFREGFRPWSTWIPGSEGWLDTASLIAPGSSPAMPLHVDLHWRLGRGELHFGAGGREATLLQGSVGGQPQPDGHFVHIVEHLLRHLRVRPHPPGIADVLRAADRLQDPTRVASLLLEGPLAPAAMGLIRAAAPFAASEQGSQRLRQVDEAMTATRRTLRPWGPSDLPAYLSGRLSQRKGRIAGIRARWGQTGGGISALKDLTATFRPSTNWLCERYPEASIFQGRMMYLGGVFRWLAGGSSPASPNQ